MHIKNNKGEFFIPNWLIVFGLLAVDSMYANHCTLKNNEKVLKVLKDSNDGKES